MLYLDTLIQFYCDELNIEFEEEEREISELADFIHDVICDFIRNDGQAFSGEAGRAGGRILS